MLPPTGQRDSKGLKAQEGLWVLEDWQAHIGGGPVGSGHSGFAGGGEGAKGGGLEGAQESPPALPAPAACAQQS